MVLIHEIFALQKKRFFAIRHAPFIVFGSFTSLNQVLNFITLLEYFDRSGFEYKAVVRFSSYWGKADDSIFKILTDLYRVRFVSSNEEYKALISDPGDSGSFVEVKLNSAKMLPWKKHMVFVIDEGISVFRTSAVHLYRAWARECAIKNKSPSISLVRYVVLFHVFRFRDSILGGIRFSMVERRLGRFYENESFLSCYKSVIEHVSDQCDWDLGLELGNDQPCFIFLTAPFLLLGILSHCEMVSLCKKIEVWCESRGYRLLIKPHPADDFRSQEFFFSKV